MAIERKIDELGRIVIPKEMRNKLGMEEHTIVSIDNNDNSIIIKSNREMKTRNEVKEKLKSHIKSNTDYYRGYTDALKWVLNKK